MRNDQPTPQQESVREITNPNQNKKENRHVDELSDMDHVCHKRNTRSGTIQTKKDLAMTCRNREKYTITVSGKLLRTPSTGSI